jgi:wyosine [tRNA(Phe)-imidazoG37] synthetase (radical SAM superfamily)
MSGYVYGPVPSRRLGRSLGIDLVPFKTCSYDCIYCQLGRTTHKTTQRREWAPLNVILSELKTHLSTKPDFITISGSGEPTLHSGIGSLIKSIHAMTDIRVAVLTNGSLLWLEEVREALSHADLVIPSLDAGNEQLFRQVNRPHRDINFHRMLNGLYEFRKSFSGRYWLEVLLVGGITALPTPVQEIAEITEWISPDRIHLNTVFRPPAESFAAPVPQELMECYATAFGDKAEVIGKSKTSPVARLSGADSREVLALVSRRPCTLEDIATGLGLDLAEASSYVEQLSAAGLLENKHQGRRLYFRVVPAEKRKNQGSDC